MYAATLRSPDLVQTRPTPCRCAAPVPRCPANGRAARPTARPRPPIGRERRVSNVSPSYRVNLWRDNASGGRGRPAGFARPRIAQLRKSPLAQCAPPGYPRCPATAASQTPRPKHAPLSCHVNCLSATRFTPIDAPHATAFHAFLLSSLLLLIIIIILVIILILRFFFRFVSNFFLQIFPFAPLPLRPFSFFFLRYSLARSLPLLSRPFRWC